MTTANKIEALTKKISAKFNGAEVCDVEVDLEFGNVTATVNKIKFVDCGWIENYK